MFIHVNMYIVYRFRCLCLSGYFLTVFLCNRFRRTESYRFVFFNKICMSRVIYTNFIGNKKRHLATFIKYCKEVVMQVKIFKRSIKRVISVKLTVELSVDVVTVTDNVLPVLFPI